MATNTKSSESMSTGAKIAAGGLGLALVGGLFAAFGSKKPTTKLGGIPIRKPCGPCGR